VKKNKQKNCRKRQFGEGLAPPAAVEKDEENKDGQQKKIAPAKSRKIRGNNTKIGTNKIIYVLFVLSVCLTHSFYSSGRWTLKIYVYM
jgi:hypothetical protein